ARSAVDMARERMSATRAEPQDGDPVEQLRRILSSFDERITVAEQRAAAAEEQLTAVQNELSRKEASARFWVIALLAWNVVMTGLVIFLLLRK
ncbi:MAG TPA: hypothetical protein VLT16_04070, partial [Candidatus Limnocylindrales bacterium]|nr:hypothetical protein [Candidatus Limnocylindrales bacterium]